MYFLYYKFVLTTRVTQKHEPKYLFLKHFISVTSLSKERKYKTGLTTVTQAQSTEGGGGASVVQSITLSRLQMKWQQTSIIFLNEVFA